VAILLFLLTWYKFPIDDINASGTGIAIDLNHRPHIFYYSRNLLVHSFWDGQGWPREIVDSAASYHNGGPSVVIDNQGRIHIAFFNRRERLSYGVYDQNWRMETVDTAYRTGDYCDIALDQNNRPHIAYHRSTGTFTGYLRYAVKTTTWQIYEHSAEYGGYHVSLELDSRDYPHISDCTSWSSGDLRYIYYDGQNWHYEKPVTGNAAGYNSLALDAFDRPQISLYWTDGSNYDLRFTEKNTGNWRLHTIDHGQRLYKRGWDNKIAIDNNHTLHIVYHCHNEGLLKYARGWEANWRTEIVDTIGGYTASTAIGLDGADVFLSYYDETSTDVWVAATKNFTAVKETDERLLPRPIKTVNDAILIEGAIQLYDLTGRSLIQGNFLRRKVIKPKKKAVYFLKTKDGIYKVVVI